MAKPGRGRAPSPVNPGDSATRQEVCHEVPPTRPRWGGFPPYLLTSTAHTYTKHKTNTDACSFTGARGPKGTVGHL